MSVPHIPSGHSQAGAELTLDTFPRHREVLLSLPWWFPLTRVTRGASLPALGAQTPREVFGTGERQVTPKTGWWKLFLEQPGSHRAK